jgi:hypothetical protein
VLVIKAQTHRSQDMNRAEAMGRLQELVDSVAYNTCFTTKRAGNHRPFFLA